MVSIDLSIIEGNKYKVLSGVDLGKKARKCFNIDCLDLSDEIVKCVVPSYVFSLNSSFFSGLFGSSICKFREAGFRNKYVFECTEIIQKNIDDGIFYVLNTKNLLGDKK